MESENQIIYEELDEFNEVIFVMEGSYLVGYSINNKQEFLPEKQIRNVIGAYGVTFGKRSLFIYKTFENISGYFIRKNKWLEIIDNDDHQDIIKLYKVQLKNNFKKMELSKLFNDKMRKLNKLCVRNDYDYILSLTFIQNQKDNAELSKERKEEPGEMDGYDKPIQIEEFNQRSNGNQIFSNNLLDNSDDD